MKNLKWDNGKTGTYLWLREADRFYWAAISWEKPHTVRIWVGDKFVQQETEYEDLDEAKAVAVALVVMT